MQRVPAAVVVFAAMSVACGLLIDIDGYHDCTGAECDASDVSVNDVSSPDAPDGGGAGCLDDAGASTCPTATPVCSQGKCVGVLSLAKGPVAYHECVVLTDGRARCWGANDRGELGPLATNGHYPVDVGIGHIAELAVGAQFTCARLDTGEVDCWGDDKYGELGDGPQGPSTDMSNTAKMVLDAGAAHISASTGACAELTDGGVVCWGRNNSGELGCPSGSDSLTPPVPYNGPNALTPSLDGPAQALAVGQQMGCFGSPPTDAGAGATRCYGGDAFGLGDGRPANSNYYCDSSHDGTGTYEVLVSVGLPSGLGFTSELVAGHAFACGAQTGTSRLFCWGDDQYGQVDGLPNGGAVVSGAAAPNIATVSESVGDTLTAGDFFACARVLTSDAKNHVVQCWGDPNHGRLANANSDNVSIVLGLADVRELAAHAGFTCAIQNDGTVLCWGLGSVTPTNTLYDLLANGSSADQYSPTPVRW